MITFDECGAMLDEIADSMPYELYRDLNGGISLLPQLKVHPKASTMICSFWVSTYAILSAMQLCFTTVQSTGFTAHLIMRHTEKSLLKYFITRFAIITSILQVVMTSEFLTEIRLTIILENTGNNQMKF